MSLNLTAHRNRPNLSFFGWGTGSLNPNSSQPATHMLHPPSEHTPPNLRCVDGLLCREIGSIVMNGKMNGNVTHEDESNLCDSHGGKRQFNGMTHDDSPSKPGF
jgi:hypothetical protein